jgi:hypothetical protein
MSPASSSFAPSSFDTLRTTLRDVEGSLGPQALFLSHCSRGPTPARLARGPGCAGLPSGRSLEPQALFLPLVRLGPHPQALSLGDYAPRSAAGALPSLSALGAPPPSALGRRLRASLGPQALFLLPFSRPPSVPNRRSDADQSCGCSTSVPPSIASAADSGPALQIAVAVAKGPRCR